MSVVDDLTAVALLGTDRRPPAASAASGWLGAALDAQPWSEDPPTAVLRAVALASVHARAGAAATTLNDALPDPAPVDTATPCSAAAAALVMTLLDEPNATPLLAECFTRLGTRGELLPPATLPAFLDRGAADPSLRAALAHGGGLRMRWLAAQRAEWRWAAGDGPEGAGAVGAGVFGSGDQRDAQTAGSPPPTRWTTGTRDERLQVLIALRTVDPAAARALVESTWSEDAPDQRASFLGALEDRLSAADEPLLERALGDRRQEVRREAAALLGALPTSAYQQRMAARLAPLVAVERRRIGGPRLTAELPPPLDAAARRDGVRDRARGTLGPRAAHLADLVAGAGTRFWHTLDGAPQDPEALLRLAQTSDHAGAIVDGWQTAAVRERDARWCCALAVATGDVDLLKRLAPADAAPAAITLIAGAEPMAVPSLLTALPGEWTPAVSAAAVKALAKLSRAFHDRPMARKIGARLSSATLDASVAALRKAAADPLALDGVPALMRVIELRQSLIRELPTS